MGRPPEGLTAVVAASTARRRFALGTLSGRPSVLQSVPTIALCVVRRVPIRMRSHDRQRRCVCLDRYAACRSQWPDGARRPRGRSFCGCGGAGITDHTPVRAFLRGRQTSDRSCFCREKPVSPSAILHRLRSRMSGTAGPLRSWPAKFFRQIRGLRRLCARRFRRSTGICCRDDRAIDKIVSGA